MKNKKQLLSIVVCAISYILMITAIIIGTNNSLNATNDYSYMIISANEMYEKIVAFLNKDEDNRKISNMSSMSQDESSITYDIDFNKIDSCSIYKSILNVHATEIAIVKVNDEEYIPILKEKFKERADSVAEEYSSYLESEYEIAKNPYISSKGNYVIMSICEYNSEIEKAFNQAFNK